jgi:hypothetical protein
LEAVFWSIDFFKRARAQHNWLAEAIELAEAVHKQGSSDATRLGTSDFGR